MISMLKRFCIVMLLFAPFGCNASSDEMGPADSTPEMSAKEKADMDKGMQESIDKAPKSQRAMMRRMMKQNQKTK